MSARRTEGRRLMLFPLNNLEELTDGGLIEGVEPNRRCSNPDCGLRETDSGWELPGEAATG